MNLRFTVVNLQFREGHVGNKSRIFILSRHVLWESFSFTFFPVSGKHSKQGSSIFGVDCSLTKAVLPASDDIVVSHLECLTHK